MLCPCYLANHHGFFRWLRGLLQGALLDQITLRDSAQAGLGAVEWPDVHKTPTGRPVFSDAAFGVFPLSGSLAWPAELGQDLIRRWCTRLPTNEVRTVPILNVRVRTRASHIRSAASDFVRCRRSNSPIHPPWLIRKASLITAEPTLEIDFAFTPTIFPHQHVTLRASWTLPHDATLHRPRDSTDTASRSIGLLSREAFAFGVGLLSSRSSLCSVSHAKMTS